MSETNKPSVPGNPELWLYDGDSATDPYLRSLDTAYTPEEGSVFVAQAAYDALSQQLAAVEAQRAQILVERDGANERAGLLLKAKDEWAERARAAEVERDDLVGMVRAARIARDTRAQACLDAIKERDKLRAAISDAEAVFVNMKRGTIAKPSLRSMIDLYGEVVNGDEAQLLEIGKLRAQVETLRHLAGELYQVLGALDAPAGVLDAVLAAAHGESMECRGSLLPFVSEEHEALRKDAERWHQCKAMPKAWWLEAMAEASRYGGRSLDESIDAAAQSRAKDFPSADCRQRLAAEGKPFPKSSCRACGQFSPKWRECDAALAAKEK